MTPTPSVSNALPPSTAPLPVAYIMSRFPKLSETFVLYEMLAVEALGASVDIFPLLPRKRGAVMHAEAAALVDRAHYEPFLSGRVIAANLHYLARRPVAYARALWDVVRGTARSVRFLSKALIIFPKAVWFARQVEARGIAHVHAHFATHATVAALVVHRLTGVPYSFTAHASDIYLNTEMLPTKVREAAFVAAISDYNRQLIAETCGADTTDKIHVIHCGVDLQSFAPRAARHGAGFSIISIGRLDELKGHRFLVESCAQLMQRGIDFTCHIVGDGPLRTTLAAQIAAAGLDERVVLHGACPRARVIELLNSADAAVLASAPTSDGRREGIPVALMEAMAAGLPVVGTTMTGMRELITHGETGLLVPPADVEALTDALASLAGHPALRATLARAGRQKIEDEFSQQSSAQKLLTLFAASRQTAPAREFRSVETQTA